VDKNTLCTQAEKETLPALIQIKQILFLDGAQSSLEEAMSAWKWEQKVRKQKHNNNKKCAFGLILIV
jgi:tetrahydromethanopterin S-methyltransferase subunit H